MNKNKPYGYSWNRVGILALFFVLLCSSLGIDRVSAQSSPTRIKDIARVLEARDNQLMGFGLVVGLRNTGDKSQTGFTQQALTNLLSRMGVVPQSVDFRSRNTAAVMVTATLNPFAKPGQKLDVTVSSVGDATSLQGGTLLVTPLQGVDEQVYAVAQGNLIVGIDTNIPSVPYVRNLQATVGRIPGGALVEKEIAVTLEGKGVLNIVLNEPDFTTANRVAAAIRQAGIDAIAKDAGSVMVSLSGGEEMVELISRVEALRVTPDTVAKIVVNERTGTIVIGENVVISPVAVAYGGIEVTIGDMNLFSEGHYDQGAQDRLRYQASSRARLDQKDGRLTVVPASPTLAGLARALNAIGASPKDLIAILQAMKKSGAIKAELEVI